MKFLSKLAKLYMPSLSILLNLINFNKIIVNFFFYRVIIFLFFKINPRFKLRISNFSSKGSNAVSNNLIP